MTVSYLCPITPVLMTMVASLAPSDLSASLAMASASSSPPLPVTALAQPELIMTPRSPAFLDFCSNALLKVTGAAWNLFLVKTAAAEQGTSEVMKARSGLVVLFGLTPTIVPDTRNPLGYVPSVGTYFFLAAGMLPETGAEYQRRPRTEALVRTAFCAVRSTTWADSLLIGTLGLIAKHKRSN